MKKTRLISLVVILITCVFLSACGGESEEIPTAPPASPPSAAETPGKSEAPEMVSPGFSEADLMLIIDGETYVCDVKVGSTLLKLGENYQYAETVSCAYDGLDKSYAYEEVEITTYPNGEEDFILDITAYSENAVSSKGIRVGASEEDVISAYGDGFTYEGILMRYEIPSGSDKIAGAALEFSIDDGVVTAIAIYAEQVIFEG